MCGTGDSRKFQIWFLGRSELGFILAQNADSKEAVARMLSALTLQQYQPLSMDISEIPAVLELDEEDKPSLPDVQADDGQELTPMDSSQLP